jgi:hypothetical protein
MLWWIASGTTEAASSAHKQRVRLYVISSAEGVGLDRMCVDMWHLETGVCMYGQY